MARPRQNNHEHHHSSHAIQHNTPLQRCFEVRKSSFSVAMAQNQTVHYDKLRGTVELKARLNNQDNREHDFSSSVLDMQLRPYHKHWVMQALVNMGSGGNSFLLGGQCRVPDPWQIELSIFEMYLQVAVRRHR